jgi:hypothetical protein
MADDWRPDELERIEAADELHIAAGRDDGTYGRPLPIWVVCVDGQVYVRTWYRREGWYGRALRSGRAQIGVPGVQADVTVEDVGPGSADLRAAVDAAYRSKYARYGSGSVERMVSDPAAESTLRLIPERAC